MKTLNALRVAMVGALAGAMPLPAPSGANVRMIHGAQNENQPAPASNVAQPISRTRIVVPEFMGGMGIFHADTILSWRSPVSRLEE